MLPSGSGTSRVARNTWKPRMGLIASPGRTARMTPLQWPMRCFSEFMSPWMRAQESRFHRGFVKSILVSKGMIAIALLPLMGCRVVSVYSGRRQCNGIPRRDRRRSGLGA